MRDKLVSVQMLGMQRLGNDTPFCVRNDHYVILGRMLRPALQFSIHRRPSLTNNSTESKTVLV